MTHQKKNASSGDDALLSLLRAAYPSPKTDIRAAVMERIAAEGKILGPVPDRTKKRAAVLNRVAKWGALAACLVLVSLIAWRLIPHLGSKNMIAADSAESYPTSGMAAQEAYGGQETLAASFAPDAPGEADAMAEADGALISEKKSASGSMNAPPAPDAEESFAARFGLEGGAPAELPEIPLPEIAAEPAAEKPQDNAAGDAGDWLTYGNAASEAEPELPASEENAAILTDVPQEEEAFDEAMPEAYSVTAEAALPTEAPAAPPAEAPGASFDEKRMLQSSPAGGGHEGDELYSPYDGRTGSIVFLPGTFAENSGEYCTEYEALRRDDPYTAPSLMYYLTHAMGLTEADLRTYYEAAGVTDVPDTLIKGLLAESAEESMQLLKDPYSFYSDGALYTVYDLYELRDDERVKPILESGEYGETWDAVSAYIAETNGTLTTYPDDLIAFVESNRQ